MTVVVNSNTSTEAAEMRQQLQLGQTKSWTIQRMFESFKLTPNDMMTLAGVPDDERQHHWLPMGERLAWMMSGAAAKNGSPITDTTWNKSMKFPDVWCVVRVRLGAATEPTAAKASERMNRPTTGANWKATDYLEGLTEDTTTSYFNQGTDDKSQHHQAEDGLYAQQSAVPNPDRDESRMNAQQQPQQQHSHMNGGNQPQQGERWPTYTRRQDNNLRS